MTLNLAQLVCLHGLGMGKSLGSGTGKPLGGARGKRIGLTRRTFLLSNLYTQAGRSFYHLYGLAYPS